MKALEVKHWEDTLFQEITDKFYSIKNGSPLHHLISLNTVRCKPSNPELFIQQQLLAWLGNVVAVKGFHSKWLDSNGKRNGLLVLSNPYDPNPSGPKKDPCAVDLKSCMLLSKHKCVSMGNHKYVSSKKEHGKLYLGTNAAGSMVFIAAHRLACFMGNGLPSAALEVAHLCHRGNCCNPHHVVWRSHPDNMAMRKKRKSMN